MKIISFWEIELLINFKTLLSLHIIQLYIKYDIIQNTYQFYIKYDNKIFNINDVSFESIIVVYNIKISKTYNIYWTINCSFYVNKISNKGRIKFSKGSLISNLCFNITWNHLCLSIYYKFLKYWKIINFITHNINSFK